MVGMEANFYKVRAEMLCECARDGYITYHRFNELIKSRTNPKWANEIGWTNLTVNDIRIEYGANGQVSYLSVPTPTSLEELGIR